MNKIVLKGEPKSTQKIYGLSCRGSFPTRYMTATGKAIKEDYEWQAKSQWRGKPLATDVEIEIWLYFGTKRKCDWDNFHKISMDALSGIVWEDDSQIKDALVHVRYDKEFPRTEILIKNNG